MTFVGCIDEIWMDYMENSDLCRTRTLFRCWKNYASKRIDRLKVCANEKGCAKGAADGHKACREKEWMSERVEGD